MMAYWMSKIETGLSRMIGLIMFLGIAQCTEPSSPDGNNNIPDADSLAHAVEWSYYVFGKGSVSNIRDIHIAEDGRYWLVGEIGTDTLLHTIPNGAKSDYANMIHWDGSRFKEYCYESVVVNGELSIVPLVGIVEGRNSILLVASMHGITELRDDSVLFHDIRGAADRWSGIPIVKALGIDKALIYGRDGYLSEMSLSENNHKYEFKIVPLSTNVFVSDAIKIANDEYYASCWWTKTSEYHFYHIKNGDICDLKYSQEGPYSRDFSTSLWASSNYVYSTCVPFMVKRRVNDTSDTVFENMFDDLRVQAIGVPFSMDGETDSDIFIVGDDSHVIHYNGESYYLYNEIRERVKRGRFVKTVVSGGVVYIVGSGILDGIQGAVLIIGRKVVRSQ